MQDIESERPDTKERLLEAACLMFAEKGFRDTTIQDICSAAGANVAAVNYHFGSKDNLYIEVWNSVSSVMMKTYVEPLSKISDPEIRLRQIVRERISQTFDEGPSGHLRKLAFREMSSPSEQNEKIIMQILRPFRNLLTNTVAQLLDMNIDDPVVQRCAFSLHSQLIFLNVLRMRGKLHHMEFLAGADKTPPPDQIEALSSHIATFVLGGIRATARQNGKIT